MTTPKAAKRIKTIDAQLEPTTAIEVMEPPKPERPKYQGLLTPFDSSEKDNRIVFDIPDKEYRYAPGVSNSALKHINPTPMHFRYRVLHPEPATQAMKVGTIFHLAIFEPDKFGIDKSHVIRPDEFKDWRSNAAKEWRDAQKLPILTQGEHEANEAMAQSIRANRQAADWLRGVRQEVAMFAHHSETGLMRKAKTDGLVSMEPVMLDVKTTEDASEFEKTAANFRYGQQEAYYRDIAADNGVEIARFVFIVVEKFAPYGVRLCELANEDVQLCRDIYRNDLRRLADCIARDEWPGYASGVERIAMPRWWRTEAELAALAINEKVPVDGKKEAA